VLVLGRRKNQALVIDGPCTVVVVEVRGGLVRLGVEAPPEVKVLREEIERHGGPGGGDGKDQRAA